MNRRFRILIPLLACLLFLSACSKTAPPPHQSDPPVPEEIPAQETEPTDGSLAGADYAVFNGTYRDLVPEAEGEEAFVQITACRDFILLEHFLCMEGSVYSFWAEEFWPYEGGYHEGKWPSVYGQSQTFSLMTRGDLYDDPPRNRTIALTEEGIALTYDDSDTEYYAADTAFSCHTSWEELKQNLGDGSGERTLSGMWSYHNDREAIAVSFEETGNLSYLWKAAGEPVQVYEGAWAPDGKNAVKILAEKIGDGQYPCLMEWSYKVDRDGMLWLTFEDQRQMILMPTEGTITHTMDRQQALSYVGSVYDMTGTYTDQYDTDYTYTYRLPQFFGDDAAVMAVNQQIMETYSPLIEMELQAMSQEEFLSYTDVNWESDIYDGIFYLHIYAEAINWQEHSAYYYDLEQGEFLTTEEVLDRLLIDPDFFLEAVRQDAEETFRAYFSDIPTEAREEYGYYEMLEWTLSEEAVNFDLPIFVNRWGSIAVYARIGSMAGPSEIRMVLYPFDGAVG